MRYQSNRLKKKKGRGKLGTFLAKHEIGTFKVWTWKDREKRRAQNSVKKFPPLCWVYFVILCSNDRTKRARRQRDRSNSTWVLHITNFLQWISAVEMFLNFALNIKRNVHLIPILDREQVNLQWTHAVMILLKGSCFSAVSWNLSFPASKERILLLNRNFANQGIELFCSLALRGFRGNILK